MVLFCFVLLQRNELQHGRSLYLVAISQKRNAGSLKNPYQLQWYNTFMTIHSLIYPTMISSGYSSWQASCWTKFLFRGRGMQCRWIGLAMAHRQGTIDTHISTCLASFLGCQRFPSAWREGLVGWLTKDSALPTPPLWEFTITMTPPSCPAQSFLKRPRVNPLLLIAIVSVSLSKSHPGFLPIVHNLTDPEATVHPCCSVWLAEGCGTLYIPICKWPSRC